MCESHIWRPGVRVKGWRAFSSTLNGLVIRPWPRVAATCTAPYHPDVRFLFIVAAATLLNSCVSGIRQEIYVPRNAVTTLITNVVIYDGTGGPPHKGSVRIADSIIVGVGALWKRDGENTVDGGGLALAPGFIDTHSHADRALKNGSDALGALSQGVTTVIVGQDGSSDFPIDRFFKKMEAGPLNVGSYVGHGTIRSRVMGSDYKREAREDEIQKMQILIAEELRSGAIGLSTGLEYDPGIYSSRAEVFELAKTAAREDGRYASHIRSEDRDFWPALDEVQLIGIGADLPVHISHLKLAMTSLWGSGDKLVAQLDAQRGRGLALTADVYPYRYWQSDLTVLFPQRNFTDRSAAEFALREVAQPDSVTVTRFDANPAYEGKTIAEIARLRDTDAPATLMALIAESEAARASGRGANTIIATSMTEPDIEAILKWSSTNICSDGELDGKHPRGFGAFTRVLGHYTRERKLFSFAEAIHKMTLLPAVSIGIPNRGIIGTAMFADLVLLDTALVADRATPAEPHALSTGIAKVWVNGVLAFENGHVTGAKAGKIVVP
jgi:N-acyl-D-amino-acid deacylase